MFNECIIATEDGEFMKKVLFVILGIDFSGAEKVLLDYLRNVDKIMPTFLTVFTGKATDVLNEEKMGKVFSCNLKFNRISFNLFPSLYSKKLSGFISTIIKEENIDVIYFNNTQEVMLANKFLKTKKGCLCVGHIHDMKSSIRSFIKKRFIISSLKKLDESITVSNACKASWKYIKHVIYNGVNTESVHKNAHEIMRVGFIGNLSKRKGFDIYQQVFASLGATFEFSAVLKADNEIDSKFKILYNLTSEQVKGYLDSIDVLVVCSRHDPLPTVILEAFTRGVICVGNSIDGIPEMIEDRSLLVEKNVSEEYVKILKHLNQLSLSDVQKIIDGQEYTILNKFSMDKKIEQVNSLLGVI